MTAAMNQPTDAVQAVVWTLPACMKCVATSKRLRNGGVEVSVAKLEESPEIREKAIADGMTEAPIVMLRKPDGEVVWWSGMRTDLIDDAVALAKGGAR